MLEGATGALTPRAEASASLDLRLARTWIASADGGAGWTPDPTPTSPELLAQGALGLSYQARRWLTFSASARAASLPHFEWAGVFTVAVTRAGRL